MSMTRRSQKRPTIYSPTHLSSHLRNLILQRSDLLSQMSLARCIPRTALVLTQRRIPQRHFHAASNCTMSSTDQPSAPTFKSIGITNTDIHKAAGVQLTPHQEVIIGSVLDLFEGRPSLRHLSLWTPTATFHDPITNAVGFDKFAAQWYGLVALFSPIIIQSHEVTSSGDPISLRLSNKYVLKGLGTEKVMDSVVDIHVGPDGRISRVEDKWNDKLPQGPFATASLTPLFSL
ncbi:hypothetical protein LCI18_001924 [Fusarium solani-melongenae]|uniref:Uncharacterized protein n=1 Tax=Fusarium solani subsp. cucurbitae TaxID=2747967 RepID=A0ACD3YPV8_FUSSC|nr:hypothetical protein LCI18_001924 [Fusarium solani-melongenae]